MMPQERHGNRQLLNDEQYNINKRERHGSRQLLNDEQYNLNERRGSRQNCSMMSSIIKVDDAATAQ
jgi:hypothetical protein